MVKIQDFTGGSIVKNSAVNAGDARDVPSLARKSPWRREW